jgi:hypothetical protein
MRGRSPAGMGALRATEVLVAQAGHEQRFHGRVLRVGGCFNQIKFFDSPVEGDTIDPQ